MKKTKVYVKARQRQFCRTVASQRGHNETLRSLYDCYLKGFWATDTIFVPTKEITSISLEEVT